LLQRHAAPGTFLRRRFFVSQFSGATATLEGPGAHHLSRVLRAEPGQLYELSDGQRLCLARVEHVGRDQVEFAVIEPLPARVPKLEATLLIAVVKFDCFEWAIEKATEMGATSIVPLAAERSEKGLLAAAPKRAARWEKIVFEAAQQARCLRPPQILSLATPQEAFARDASGIRILMSERAGDPTMKDVLVAAALGGATAASTAVRLSLGVGPEGGWAEEEFAAAETAGFTATSLGSNILRTETAVLAGLAAAHLYFD
jgi:16S rRNA (uracil1498-N3)-methyltransferase